MSASNQWEVVTKSKKAKNLERKVEAHTEKKRVDALLPKLEEIMPSNEYRNLIGGKENLSPTKSSSSSTKSKSPKKSAKEGKEQTVKKQQQQQPQQQQHKPKAAAKPKSLEVALRSITPEDFASQLEQLKMVYPGSELLWLKGVASFFNMALPFDCDPIFSGKSIHYPSNLATQALKTAVVAFLESVGEENLAYFYHTLLSSMTIELSKNLPILGYKFVLQLIGQHWPQVVSNSMAKTALLRNSYQNRSNICLSILWAIGQGGYQQLTEGIKVWQNLMLPNLEMKSYSKFVCEYLEKILGAATDKSSINLNQNEFFLFYNELKANHSIPRECQELLSKCAEEFLVKYIKCTGKHANIFVTLFRNIEDASKSRSELLGCVHCLVHGVDSFKVWKMNYKKQLVPSLLLLKEIENQLETDGVATALARLEAFNEFLLEAQKLNAELNMAKRRDANLDELVAVVVNVQEKTAQQKKKQNAGEQKKCGCCKWVLGSLLLIGLIAGALAYDTQVNGKGVFEKSATGKVLKNAGLLPHVEKAWYVTMGTSARGYKWAEQNVPPYAQPVGKLACDLFKLARNTVCNVFGVLGDLASAKLPVAANFLEQYVPGLPKQIENTSVSVKNVCVNLFGKTVSFFKTQVFVGTLSPENLSKALNQTQNVALEYYYLFHKKVDAYAKLK